MGNTVFIVGKDYLGRPKVLGKIVNFGHLQMQQEQQARAQASESPDSARSPQSHDSSKDQGNYQPPTEARQTDRQETHRHKIERKKKERDKEARILE